MPYALTRSIASDIGGYMWNIPIGNAMVGKTWGGAGLMMGSVLSQLKKGDGETVKLSALKEKVSTTAMENPIEWEELGKITFKKMINVSKTKSALEKEGVSATVGFRCNQFAAAMVYLLKLNRNVETTVEVVRMGESSSNCHYIVVLGRAKVSSSLGGNQISTDKSTWGDEHIVMDPWGARQRKHVLSWVTEENGISRSGQPFFIRPHEFGNQLFSICEWRLPQPRYI